MSAPPSPVSSNSALLLEKESLDLLLNIRQNTHVHWSGKHRAPLTGQVVYPRPLQDPLPVWLGVGGTPGSFIRAGMLGFPLMVAIIGGEPHRFRPLIDRYREAGLRAGHSPDQLKVGISFARLCRRQCIESGRRILSRLRAKFF